MRRCLYVFLILSGILFFAWEGYRGFLAILLRRGQYALLERWGGESCFFPALRHFHANPPDHYRTTREFEDWVKHRFEHRFPDQDIHDASVLPTGELALLLRRTEESKARTGSQDEECRVILVDPARSDLQVASSEPLDHNAGSMSWHGEWVLLHGGGSLIISAACHREGATVRLIPSVMEVNGAPWLWGAPRFEDIDGDGIPEVICQGSDREPCPTCGRPMMPRQDTWKFIDGVYKEWAVKDYWCAAGCKTDKAN